jgi:dihydrofolate synthase/folylpolyglutamate synthase
MKKLKETVLKNFIYKKLILVISISDDKDYRSMMSEIVPVSGLVILTRHKVMNRGINPKTLAEEVKKYSKKFVIVDDVKDAVEKALSSANKKDMILVTGSIFTVAEARELWFKDVDVRWGRELNEAP